MFTRGIDKRMKIILLIFSSILLVIVLRVFYVQVVDYKKLSTLASDLWSRNLPIEASRGRILDRNGVVLADNITTTSLVLIPNQIKNKKEVTTKLAEILGVSFDEMKEHVYKETSIERVHPEGRRLSYEVADKIEALNFDGVYLVKESKRYYPYEEMLSHVLGYVGIDNQGLSGIELQYDDYLTGEDGSIKYFSDGKGHKLELAEIYEAPTSGITLQLTVDIELQQAVENELDNAIAKYDADSAIAIAMDPDTGEILAMASRPNFDSNDYQSYSAEVINRNLPIWMTFEPGSTFKIITLSAAIEEGLVNIFEDRYTDSGAITVDGATLHCWKHGGHGDQSYLEVVENSCNPGFVNLGLKLGKETLMEYIDNYGFGEKTGIDLNGEGSGILFDVDAMGNVELATTAFGQGISVTPIHLTV